MTITKEYVQDVFGHLTTGESEKFFQHVADNVSWRVMGTHPLAGTYHSKEDFLNHTFRRLSHILQQGVKLAIKHIYLCDDVAIVEMESISTAISGKPFDNTYCWVTRFVGNEIVEVRAYVDSELVCELVKENE